MRIIDSVEQANINGEMKMQIGELVSVNHPNGVLIGLGTVYKFLKSGRVQVRLICNSNICSFNKNQINKTE
jgi:hypothetical protein